MSPNRQSWDDNLRDVLISYKKGIYAFGFIILFIWVINEGWLSLEMFQSMIQTMGDFFGTLGE